MEHPVAKMKFKAFHHVVKSRAQEASIRWPKPSSEIQKWVEALQPSFLWSDEGQYSFECVIK